MVEYLVQYTWQDMAQRVFNVRQPENKRERESLQHALASEFIGCGSRALKLLERRNPKYAFPFSKGQKLALSNLFNFIEMTLLQETNLWENPMPATPKDDRLEQLTRRITKDFKRMLPFVPLIGLEETVGAWPEGSKPTIQEIDSLLASGFYSYNRAFSPAFQVSEFILYKDLAHYLQVTANSQERQRMFFDELSSLQKFSSPVDYFTHVILPMINNIYDHAVGNPPQPGEATSTHPYGFVMVDFGSAQRPDGSLEVLVVNTGQGVDPAIKGRLFTRNATTKTDTEQEHGLGLYLAREFVENHGGKIWCESEPGCGAQFKFTIPPGKYQMIFGQDTLDYIEKLTEPKKTSP